MPYRRLPATDTARLKALHTVLQNDDVYTVQKKRVVEWATLRDAQHACDEFERAVGGLRLSRRAQPQPDGRYEELFRRARMFVSHFIQVLHMCMERGEIPQSAQAFYGMRADDLSLPQLATERQVIDWGERIIKGEHARLEKGGIPVYNPNIAKVAVHYDLFREQWQRRGQAIERSGKHLKDVQTLRAKVDDVIRRMWDEIERAYANLPAPLRLDSCRRLGVVYYCRRHEKPLPQAGGEQKQPVAYHA